MAKGADSAVRIEGEYQEPVVIGFLLARALKETNFDLILCGAFAADDGYAACGPVLASFLGIPYACYVSKINFQNGHLAIERELEGGKVELKELPLPALLTIQTGINTPRYASLLGIKRAQSKEIKVYDLAALNTTEEEIREKSSLSIFKLAKPKREAKAEFLTGTLEEISEKVANLIKTRGLR